MNNTFYTSIKLNNQFNQGYSRDISNFQTWDEFYSWQKFFSCIKNAINQFPENGYKLYNHKLGRGTSVLQTNEELNAYLAFYGEMHYIKLFHAFEALFKTVDLNTKNIEIVDWGCGQAFATCTLIDYFKENSLKPKIQKITLLEPSVCATKQGANFLEQLFQNQEMPKISVVNKLANDITKKDLSTNRKNIKIHLFSNMMDISAVDPKQIAATINKGSTGENIFVCVGPPINTHKLIEFYSEFSNAEKIDESNKYLKYQIFRPSLNDYKNHPTGCYYQIFKANIKSILLNHINE